MRSRTSRIVVVLIALCVIGIVVAGAYYRPTITVQVESGLVGPQDERVWSLLLGDAPLEDIKKAVRDTGKHPDQMVWIGGSLLSNAVDKQRKDLVAWLIEQGANPNGITPNTSPLVYAIWNKDPEMIRLLIKYGSNPDLDMGDGMTPRSVAEGRGNPAVIETLDQSGKGDMEAD